MPCADQQALTDPPHTVEDGVREELRSFVQIVFVMSELRKEVRWRWKTKDSQGEKQLMARHFEELRGVHITSWS